MFRNPYSPARRTNILRNAVQGIYFLNDGGGEGGGATPPAVDPPAPKPPKGAKPEPTPPTPAKLELTPEELQAKIDAAVKAVSDKQAEKDRKAREDADAEAARQKGEWEKVAKDEESKRTAAEAEIAKLRLETKRAAVKDQIRDYLAEHHKGYVGTEKWILPAIEYAADTAPEDVTKRVKAAADQYVKDNPRAAASAGVSADGRSGSPRGSDVPRPRTTNNENGTPVITGAASRF